MISPRLLALVRCPECGGTLGGPAEQLTCGACKSRFSGVEGAYLDLRPTRRFEEQTKYLDEALHADARHERVSPPLLGAGVRNRMLRAFLRVGLDDRVLDLGCGSGRSLVWNHDLGAYAVGVDITPHFAVEARRDADLLLADLRRLPFADGAFTKAYSLDVLEHLSREALDGMLREAARVLAPGGVLFVYSHVRKNSPLAAGLRWINRLARGLERAGLVDLAQERLRKSDHVNPLADIPDLDRAVRAAGFRIGRIRYYTPLVGGFIENVLARMAERALTRRASRSSSDVGSGAVRAARANAKARIAQRGVVYATVKAATWMMHLDVILFGRVRSGPFFALLVKEGAERPA